jgi:hypothetical protein
MEGFVRAISIVKSILAGLARLTMPRRRPFECGDCERWQRCGRPPSDECIVLAAQLARDAEKSFTRSAVSFW